MKHSSKLVALPVAALTALATTHTQADDVDFEKQVWPIIEAKCVECHKKPYLSDRGRLKKPKSGLRLDGAKFYKAGGSIQEDENKKVIVPGKADESTLYTFTTLPEDDDLYMPPKGDGLTGDEKEILKKWIDAGASFGDWKGDESEYQAE